MTAVHRLFIVVASDTPDESAHQVTGDSGFTYIPEPAGVALLALGAAVALARRRRAA